jgi:hypothetical protein
VRAGNALSIVSSGFTTETITTWAKAGRTAMPGDVLTVTLEIHAILARLETLLTKQENTHASANASHS